MKRIIVGLALLLMTGSQAFAGGFSWQSADTSYLIDPDGRFMERFIEACEKGQDEKSRRFYRETCKVKVLAKSGDGTLYHLTREDDGSRVDMDGDENYQLFVMQSLPVTFEKETLSQIGDGEPIVNEWFYLTHAVQLKIQGDSIPFISSEGVIKLMRLNDGRDNKGLKPDDPNQVFESLASIAREARILQYLKHPHISRLIPETETFAVQERFDQNFDTYLGTAPDLAEVLDHCKHLADALSYCHSHGVVHGDFCTGHILMKTDGTAMLGDFGRAHILKTASAELQAAGEARFTYVNNRHHAPEARFPEGLAKEWLYIQLEPAADVWSFGHFLAVTLNHYPEYRRALARTRLVKPMLEHFAERKGLPAEVYKKSLPDEGASLGRYVATDLPLDVKAIADDGAIESNHPLIKLIIKCTDPNVTERPDMTEVCKALQGIRL
ncbi:protein kinase domain-containing protein [Spongorhabdus nitratireducens]